MIEFQPIRYDLKPETKRAFYREVLGELSGLMEPVWWTNLATASAVLNAHLPEINWVGFYLAVVGQALAPQTSDDASQQLLLGPFQGMPACLRIPIGKGVCGTAAASRQSVIVADVEKFPGHIPCDSRSRSEIVVPLVKTGRLLGVLDVDSPNLDRFDDEDRQGLEAIGKLLVESCDWP